MLEGLIVVALFLPASCAGDIMENRRLDSVGESSDTSNSPEDEQKGRDVTGLGPSDFGKDLCECVSLHKYHTRLYSLHSNEAPALLSHMA